MCAYSICYPHKKDACFSTDRQKREQLSLAMFLTKSTRDVDRGRGN
jgi:hypothetical protein